MNFFFSRLNFSIAIKDFELRFLSKISKFVLVTSRIRPTYFVLQNCSRLSGPDVNQAKDEFEDHLAYLVCHSTTGVFHQSDGRVFTSQVCTLSKSMWFLTGLFFSRTPRAAPCIEVNEQHAFVTYHSLRSLLWVYSLHCFARLARVCHSRIADILKKSAD